MPRGWWSGIYGPGKGTAQGPTLNPNQTTRMTKEQEIQLLEQGLKTMEEERKTLEQDLESIKKRLKELKGK
jgi:predicted  nucleic acid-binding Zn-ribbon protein